MLTRGLVQGQAAESSAPQQLTAFWSGRRQITWVIRPHKQSSVLLPKLSNDEDMLRLDALNRVWSPPRTPTTSDALRLIRDTLTVLDVLEPVR